MIVTLFVDDGLACCTSVAKLEELIKYMELKFEITRSSADLYVGLYIHHDRPCKLLYVNQSIYIKRTLAKFGFSGCTPMSTPADPNIKLDSTPAPHQDVPFSYSGAVGSLQFPQMGSHPDISYAMNTVAKFASQPQQPHYLAVARIFRYLAGTINLSICYYGQAGSLLSQSLEAYSDADYAGDITD